MPACAGRFGNDAHTFVNLTSLKCLAGILERREIARQVKAGDTTTLAALIFHHNGNPKVDIRKAWKSACKKAGVPGRLFHDLRRSAVKNLDEAGVSRDVAMQISERKTQAMYSRYNIADVKRVRKGGKSASDEAFPV
jgi:integrase